MRKQIEVQADRIEAVLMLNKVPAHVTGGTVTPRWVRFYVLPAASAKAPKIKGLGEELAAALNANTCRVSRRGAAITVEVPRNDPQPVRLLPLLCQLVHCQPVSLAPACASRQAGEIPGCTAVLGLTEDGRPLLIRLPSPDVGHILVAGTAGSGKTMLLQAMILSLALLNSPSSLSLVLMDPKGHAFNPFDGLPHLARPVIRDVGEMKGTLQSLMRLMENRINTQVGGIEMQGLARVVVVIDELADLLMVGGKDVQLALTRLTQRGREAGIHIIAATQKPTAAVLGPLVKANFPVRLVGRVTSIEDARTATGWSGTGAERLLGCGDFIAVAECQLTRFQAARVSPEEIQAAVAQVKER